MPWGKFKHVPIHTIESSYLCWVLDHAEQLRSPLRAAIKAELASRFAAPSPPSSSAWRKPCPDRTIAADIVSAGVRALARRHHPDVGGDTAVMQTINAAADWLHQQVPQ